MLSDKNFINTLHQNEFLVFENMTELILHTDGSGGFNSPIQFIKKEEDLEEVKNYYIKK